MIYDCFTFFNELDLLEIRLNILNDYVDKFVLVEATKTHQGKDKPLHFSDNKNRFQKFLPKIIHIVIDEYPEYEGKSAWVLEHHQRNMILKGLENCTPDDVILISDLDEIPRPERIKEYSNQSGIIIFRQTMYYYFLNCINATNSDKYRWNGTVMVSYKDIIKPQELREMSLNMGRIFHQKIINRVYWRLNKLINIDSKGIKIRFINNGGWHFSYLGGVDAIIKKLESFAHTEYNSEEFKNPERIKEAINRGEDIFGRGFSYRFVKLDDTFPKFIVDNKDKYNHLVKE